MMRTARKLKGEIETKVGSLAGGGSQWGLFAFVFLMVFREGIETVAILAGVSLNSTELMSFLGTLLGVALAVVFGVMFVKGSVRIDLRKFFKVTTVILFFVATQLIISGLHELSENGVLPSSREEMALIGPIVRNDLFFFITIVALAALMVLFEVKRIIVGQDVLLERMAVALLSGGHLLVEGVPGLAKTLAVKSLAAAIGGQFQRIQFTPDLVPADLVGTRIFNPRTGEFSTSLGPVFTHLLLADEINRAPAKTQSSLLEAMQERSVTVDGTTRPLPEPFFVIATQNPIESQGTYPLPEAQLDRFLFKLDVRPPSVAIEKAILASHLAGFDASALDRMGLNRVTTPEELIAMQTAIRGIRVDDSLLEYIADIVWRTRSHRSLYFGASPRASIALLAGAQARAVTAGRDFVIPDDVKAVALPVLRHRVTMSPSAEIEGLTTDRILREILDQTPAPR
jgi:MoxR-like ATPase